MQPVWPHHAEDGTKTVMWTKDMGVEGSGDHKFKLPPGLRFHNYKLDTLTLAL